MNAVVAAIVISAASLGQTSSVTYVSTLTQGLEYPARLASVPLGGVYVTDPTTKQVVQYDSAGVFVATFTVSQVPWGIAAHPDGRVFVSRGDGAIGVYSPVFAALGTVNPAPMTMTAPNDLAYDAVNNELYAVDSGADRVLVFTESAPTTWTLARSWGMGGTALGLFTSPQAIAVHPGLGRVMVTDSDNYRVQVFDRTGLLLFKFGYRVLFLPTLDLAWFSRVSGVTLDSCGNIYLSDALMGTVRVFSGSGVELGSTHTPLIGYGTGTGQLRAPCDLTIDASGMLYVASTNNGAVTVYNVACATPIHAPPTPDDEVELVASRKERKGAQGRAPAPTPPQLPDNPSDLAAAIVRGDYCAEWDLNVDGQLDWTDFDYAVAAFGAGSAEDFLPGALASAPTSHPSLEPPHILNLPNRCGRCHSMDGAPGGMLTAAGQENLCQSCHSAGKIAGDLWIGPGSDLNSHPWGIAADAGLSDGPPVGSDLALHLDNGNIRCGTCHEPHNLADGFNYLRRQIYDTITITTTGAPIVQRPMTVMNSTLCAECHTEIAAEFDVAGHYQTDADALIHYDWPAANRATCRQCHSGFGYIDFTNGLASAQQRGTHRTIDCLVCHSTHGEAQSGDLLRTYGTVTVPGGTVISNVGSAATCMVCHNGRNAVADPGFTPHYLLGGVMLAGVNGITLFRGIQYGIANSAHSTLLTSGGLTCATCHMTTSPVPGNPGAGKVGGHTFNMAVNDPADPDFGFENVANACGGCHTGLTTFNRLAGGDYDGDITIEGVQDETQGLLDLVLATLQAKGAIQLPGFPYWIVAQCQGGTNPGTTCTANSSCLGGGTCVTIINPPADRPIVEDAIWNWEFVDNSTDLGVKNTAYAVGLLQVAYKGLTGVGVPGAAYRYFPAP